MINKNNRIDIQSVQSTLDSCANGDSEINEITLSDLIVYLHSFTIESGELYQNDLYFLYENLMKLEEIEENKKVTTKRTISLQTKASSPAAHTSSRRNIKNMISNTKQTVLDIARMWGDIIDHDKDSRSLNSETCIHDTDEELSDDETLPPRPALKRSKITFGNLS